MLRRLRECKGCGSSPTFTHVPVSMVSSKENDFGSGRLLKTTQSICPNCLKALEAEVFERQGKVWMDKTCQDCGWYSALLSSDASSYHVSPETQDAGCSCGPAGCGTADDNHSCTLLVEITQKCNLTCPTCYAASSPQNEGFLSVEEYSRLLDTLRERQHGDADVLQLSGGEPTLHPDLLRMIEIAYEKGFKQVYLNTNGLKLSQESYARSLAELAYPVFIYLQFDGMASATYAALRGNERLADVKVKALRNCEALNIEAVPIMTLTKGVNDEEVGLFLEIATQSKAVNKVMIQPAMYSGRYYNPRRVDRLTAADAIERIVEQSSAFETRDFTPIPCGDPNCFRMALALKTEKGLIPVSRYFPPYEKWREAQIAEKLESVSDTFDNPDALAQVLSWSVDSGALGQLSEAEVDVLLDVVAEATEAQGKVDWQGLFAIGIKPFMDAYTYDQDRIDACCAHIASRSGEPVSFCQYNAINRAKGEL